MGWKEIADARPRLQHTCFFHWLRTTRLLRPLDGGDERVVTIDTFFCHVCLRYQHVETMDEHAHG